MKISMSSPPLSSKHNTFVQSQAQYFNRQNSDLNLQMNINRHSPAPSPSLSPATTTTHIIGPRPFYRSRVTPDRFDYTNNNQRENDYRQYLQNRSQRRFSINQINGETQIKR